MGVKINFLNKLQSRHPCHHVFHLSSFSLNSTITLKKTYNRLQKSSIVQTKKIQELIFFKISLLKFIIKYKKIKNKVAIIKKSHTFCSFLYFR
jgi:hypothetical protein